MIKLMKPFISLKKSLTDPKYWMYIEGVYLFIYFAERAVFILYKNNKDVKLGKFAQNAIIHSVWDYCIIDID